MTKKIKPQFLLAFFFLLGSTKSYAGELDGLGEALLGIFLFVIVLILVIVMMVWGFRKNTTFILFTFCNLLLFFLFFALFASSDSGSSILPYLVITQIAAQIIAVFKALSDRASRDK